MPPEYNTSNKRCIAVRSVYTLLAMTPTYLPNKQVDNFPILDCNSPISRFASSIFEIYS